jgi:hypothetical protein
VISWRQAFAFANGSTRGRYCADPSTNVELYSTETVPNWSLRDAANDWCAANGLTSLEDPECCKRKLAGGINSRDSRPPGSGGVGGGFRGLVGGLVGEQGTAGFVAAVGEMASSLTNGFARAAMGRLGMSPSMAAHVFALGVLTLACVVLSCAIITLEGVLTGLGAQAMASRVDTMLQGGYVQNLAWWAGIFSIVWLAQGGFVDPIRADMERRRRSRRARGMHLD